MAYIREYPPPPSSTLQIGACNFAPLQRSRRDHRFYVWTEDLSGMVFVTAHAQKLPGMVWRPIQLVTLHFRDRHDTAQPCNITEITAESPFLCVNRSPIISGMVFVPAHAQKLPGMVWRPIQLVTLHFRDRHDTAQPCNITEITAESPFLCVNRSPIISGMVFVAAQKLSGILLT